MLDDFNYVWPFVTLWTVTYQAPPSMGFSRQEYWTGLPFPPPANLPKPGIKLMSLMSLALARRFFTTSTIWEASLVPQMVKNLPAMPETKVWSLGGEDPLEEEIAIHTNMLAWRIPWKRSLAGYRPWGQGESVTTDRLTLSQVPWPGIKSRLPALKARCLSH